MTTLTMAQRRQDFEAMLARVDQVRRAVSKFWAKEEDTPGKPIANLARDAAELCTSWVVAAKRAGEGHPPSDQVKNLAVIVAARCLHIICSDEDLSDMPTGDLLAAITNDAEEWFGAHADEWLDLGVNPCVRAQCLIQCLGQVSSAWPITPDWPSPYGYDCADLKFGSLVRLTFEATCAALAAERGLWQEEES
jgi:hypothetical protein